VTPASFEPTIDYVVTKIPRFAFEKYKGTEPVLTTAMKSVGEAMAIGRNFKESLQKALNSLETGLTGLNEMSFENETKLRAALAIQSPDRLRVVATGVPHGSRRRRRLRHHIDRQMVPAPDRGNRRRRENDPRARPAG
jgi:carbamoyl-phosphate synthase large subunit